MFWLPRNKQTLQSLQMPEWLNRNAKLVQAAGVEDTGQILIEYATKLCGLASLASMKILDVGCGSRFTATIINRKIPIGSYTGIEVDKRLVNYLKRNVEYRDRRFKFQYWNVYNAGYKRSGRKLSEFRNLPAKGPFDIVWLFSVFTHLEPTDAKAMLRLVRAAVKDEGRLVFSAFVDENIGGFEDRVPDKPLHNAYYGGAFIRDLIVQNGWSILAEHPADEAQFIQHHFVCRPT